MGGFRNNRSHFHVKTCYGIVQGGRVYLHTAFIGLKQAFDSVKRIKLYEALMPFKWRKLVEMTPKDMTCSEYE